MEETIVDILHADMVLVGVSLLNQQSDRDAFAREIGAELTTTEIGIGPPPQGDMSAPLQTTVEIARDRISIAQVQSRTTIRRDYPSQMELDDDLERLADVAIKAIRHSERQNQQKRAHGYNMACTFDLGLEYPAVRYIGQQLFSNTFEDTLVGGTARLVFLQEDGSQVTFDVQPRPNNDLQSRTLFVALNVHCRGDRMPKPEQVRTSLKELKPQIMTFMAQLNATG